MSRLRNIARALGGIGAPKLRHTQATIKVSSLPSYRYCADDGEKFHSGYGPTDILWTDYWTLRARSAELFEKNLYARGIVRRIVTNWVNTGLHLEAEPEESILGIDEEVLADWSEDVETRFALWARDKRACDFHEERTFGELQQAALLEALVSGDVLCVLMLDQRTNVPRVRLVSGAAVQTPVGSSGRAPNGNPIVHGVELDDFGRHVAYWIHSRRPGEFVGRAQRLPAYGSRSGRRVAWLFYGTERRLEQTRGKPLLSLVLQSLKEIDRYRDSVQLKATVNSIIAAWIQRDQETSLGSSITGDGGALRKTSTITSAAGTDRVVRESEMVPGLVIEHLEAGEKIIAQPSHGTDEKFGTFEEAIIQAVAWHYEIPPEILRLSFSHNYSASQAATNEFKMTLNRWRACFASGFTQAIYEDWLVQQVLMGKVDAPGFLESLRDPLGYDTTSAWLQADWSGQIKPAVDEVKLTNAHVLRLQNGLTTYSRATREINGQKFSRVVKQLKKERALLEDAGLLLEPSAPAQQPPPAIEPERDEEDKDEEALPLVRRIA